MMELKRRKVLHHAGNATINIPYDLHRVLRLFCKSRGLTQAHVATEAITGYIQYHKIKEEKEKYDSIRKRA